ncbi:MULTISPECIES: response regulator [unclassified Pseudomonas]|uniref:response regulator n=1 Tax=unclassified Pseudomonas TaxID=196821 RepID=UPI000BDD8AB5|nr:MULTISPECIES: response regulator [unclassified Pseudomonas]PVZ20249.1 response regulator receiver domain-containing protein [Pseudomonas sp. URIL14HWK12:I12]PVZ27315.1 response regulator receiver domain-containing protein [Pseudomonas sp. URIL14HWK12:I10]PVZ38204.1 response regulator receiver domain-containing protein [Pseudomonas sp. URIL14HWK12:I11]SNZ04249.1 Response regulator containing CheY-like receiver, AAA-type ATPase, and DNA-binding domains [Pseudomonas sp. URIL14HWK12:I9]
MSGDAQDVVLVVEDEPVILRVLADYLMGEGYHVLQAENGTKAFEILASKPHLDLMVTDFRLPGGISGVDIAEPAVKLRPDLKVVFISGYPAEILDCDHPIAHRAPILAKPFDLDELQRVIRKELA